MVVATKQKPKVTPVHRKRTGQHQKRGTHFTKAYWPYLPLALIIGAGIFFNTYFVQPNVLSYATNMTTTGLLQGTNTERAKTGIGTLALNDTLTKAAQEKANDMASRNYWSHTTPDGFEPWKFIDTAGYKYLAAGENLAYGFGTSEQAIIGWMNSPGHRANILNNDYTEVGFGIVNSANYQSDGEQTIVVAMYAKPAAQNTAALQSAATDASIPESQGQPITVAQSQATTEPMAVSAVVPGPRKIAQIQMATSGSAPWTLYAASIAIILLLFLLLARHSLAWHRALVRGEEFLLKHKLLDVIIVTSVVVMIILTQTAGYIQ